MHEIMTVLSPALRNQKPRNLIIYGKTGTGKTCCIKRVTEELAQAALGRPLSAFDRSVDVHVSRLRNKLEDGGAQALIYTERGTGYRMTASLPPGGKG